MNGKKAKALRREAESQTVGSKPTAYHKVPNRTNRAIPQPHRAELDPHCTRYRYQKLKAAAK